MSDNKNISRRSALGLLGAGTVAGLLPSMSLLASARRLKRKIPKTGEEISALGMGTWITFNVGRDTQSRNARTQVLKTFFEAGGGMIDSSPMYGSAEEVVGYALNKLGRPGHYFSATKVWTPFTAYGKRQVRNSQRLWGIQKFDLFQIHNLVNWQAHLETLQQMKADGKLRYIGVTTSHGLRHEELEAIMKSHPVDFIQLTYNVLDRKPEKRLLPLAAERKIGVIVNRPFRRGGLFDRFEGKPLPDWKNEIDCKSWAQFFLKFILSHPSVTCAIPATSQVAHMKENMEVLTTRLPSPELRTRMLKHIEAL